MHIRANKSLLNTAESPSYMKETLPVELLNLDGRCRKSKYDGKLKHLTENCPSCRFDVTIDNQERCYWGVAWKVLVPTERPRECQFYDQPSPREESHKELLELTKKNAADLESFLRESKANPKPPSSGYMDCIGRWEKNFNR